MAPTSDLTPSLAEHAIIRGFPLTNNQRAVPKETISVCMATFNGQRYLCQQIDSILCQLGSDDELVVSDDGSTDQTLNLLASYGARVRLVGHDRAGGVTKNFERALTAARGDIVLLSDQDDVWLDGRVALIRNRLRDKTMLMMNGIVVDSALKPYGEDVFGFVGFRGGFIRNFARPKYVGCCIAFRRELLVVALPFPRLILWHDWYLSLVAELLFKSTSDSRKTILFRRHANNASPTGQRSQNTLWVKLVARFWMARAVAIAASRHFVHSARRRCHGLRR